MAAAEIDAYLAALDEPKRSTLATLRRTILEIMPDAEQGISYAIPAFRVQGHVIAGFAAYKNHLSYFPHSGSVLPEIGAAVAGYATSTGTLQFPIDTPLARELVEQLLAVRLRQAIAKAERASSASS